MDVSHGFGSLMSYQILTESGIPISISTVQHLTLADLETDVMNQQCETFDKAILVVP